MASKFRVVVRMPATQHGGAKCTARVNIRRMVAALTNALETIAKEEKIESMVNINVDGKTIILTAPDTATAFIEKAKALIKQHGQTMEAIL